MVTADENACMTPERCGEAGDPPTFALLVSSMEAGPGLLLNEEQGLQNECVGYRC